MLIRPSMRLCCKQRRLYSKMQAVSIMRHRTPHPNQPAFTSSPGGKCRLNSCPVQRFRKHPPSPHGRSSQLSLDQGECHAGSWPSALLHPTAAAKDTRSFQRPEQHRCHNASRMTDRVWTGRKTNYNIESKMYLLPRPALAML